MWETAIFHNYMSSLMQSIHLVPTEFQSCVVNLSLAMAANLNLCKSMD